MYGSINYGANQYGQELETKNKEIELYRPDLLAYLPPDLRKIKEFKVWDDVVGYELALLNWKREDLIKQCFIGTATWGLGLWEDEYGIETDLNKSYEERREILKAKKRGHGTVTKKLIKETAEAFSGGEVEIIEHPESYSFVVQFIGIKGIPRNMGDFKEMLETIKPAHLAYEFKYTLTVWNFLKEQDLTWQSSNSKTWDELRVYEGDDMDENNS
ncbi:portal protein (endogenous virus) [Clostridium phage phiCT9441A]|uniref:tail protein n=1 Tax=Clostridium phage phiCT9441A TaxID=1567014 RepID=UPI0005140540|nr:YmfQ family protein [Clostridium tetani]YP_009219433.1 tail protein [Clostridium phage phiCT9441A]AJA42680.1 portal protein [Clostridium phage phiCT9441A]KGI40295.1 phage portal protein [Clostridium tetani ATCC 9441]SUY66166.1 phage-like element pbsx protein xkdT [Clostridium tetani]BDR66960.1 hypothetical protein K144312032_11880 [Clostridium tetani]